MPPPDRILTTLRQAITLTRATPGRQGHILRLQECREVLVAGDLHGHIGNFQAILKAADLDSHPARHLVLQEIIHSPFKYSSGSDRSHQLVDLYAALKGKYPKRVHLLPGNHELAQWTGRIVIKTVENQNLLFENGVRTAYGPVYAPKIYDAYLDLFRASPLAIYAGNGVLICHSLPPMKWQAKFDRSRLEQEEFEDRDVEPGGTVYSLLWGRDTEPETARAFLGMMDADLLISGHIACDQGFDVPNDQHLIVDCCASPSSYVLVPTDRRITHKELVAGVRIF